MQIPQLNASPLMGSMNGMYAAKEPAIIYIFQPNHAHRLGIQAHRPLLYRFDDQFVNKALDVTSSGATAGGPDYMTMMETMLRSNEARQSLLTTDQPDALINLDPLNSFYRFMMILNKPKAPNLNGTSAFSPLVTHRVIITGYCLDEPINMATQTPNPNCQLVFTHKTIFETIDVQNPMGTVSNRLSTKYDANIVNHALPTLSTDHNLYYIDPAHAYDSTYDNSGGQTISSPGHEQRVGFNETNKAIATTFDNPETNMKWVLGNIVSSQREVTDRPHMAHLYGETHVAMPHQQMETFHEVLNRNMRSYGHSASLLGPNENDVMTMGSLIGEYHPIIQPVLADGTSMFGVMDQQMLNGNNMFCSLIASAFPSIMSTAALAAISFKFESYYDKNDPFHEYGLRIETLIPAMPMDTEVLKRRAQAVVGELSRTVFRTLYSLKGDFTLHASVDMGGLTHLWLHFHCDAMQYMEPYEHPTCYGGLVTPSYGTAMSIATNSQQMAELVSRLTMDSMAPPAGWDAQMPGFHNIDMTNIVRPDLTSVFDDVIGDTPDQSTPGTTSTPGHNGGPSSTGEGWSI